MSNEMKDWLRDNEEEQKAKWMNEVKAHHELAANYNAYERAVMFTCLYGSQNYGLATDTSDVDTKSYVFPSIRDAAFHRPLLSAELTAQDGSHVEMKDYRDMFANIRKQSMNFLETLFTPYVVVDENWQKLYNCLHEKREELARLDVNRGAMATFGHMCNMYKRYLRDENPKQAAHLMRLHDVLQRYALTDEPYEDLLFKPNSLDYLRIVREGKVSPQELKEMCETFIARGEYIVKEMPKHEVNKNTLEWLELAELMSFDEGMRLYYFRV